MIERGINEEFQYKNHNLIVVESDKCKKCFFSHKPCFIDPLDELIGKCEMQERSDGKNVIFLIKKTINMKNSQINMLKNYSYICFFFIIGFYPTTFIIDVNNIEVFRIKTVITVILFVISLILRIIYEYQRKKIKKLQNE